MGNVTILKEPELVSVPPLDELSKQLADRFPDTPIKRFKMPKSVRECREVFIREMTSKDEIFASVLAEQVMTQEERQSMMLTNEAQRRQMAMLSVVAIGEVKGNTLVYRHVNPNPAEPFLEPLNWSLKACNPLFRWFAELNGVPTAEIDEGTKGAQLVGAFYVPEEIQQSASTGKSAAGSGKTT